MTEAVRKAFTVQGRVKKRSSSSTCGRNKSDIVRVYLPPDANSLLYISDHCPKSWNRINVIVADKQPAPQWLTMDQGIKHYTAGIGHWGWARNDRVSTGTW